MPWTRASRAHGVFSTSRYHFFCDFHTNVSKSEDYFKCLPFVSLTLPLPLVRGQKGQKLIFNPPGTEYSVIIDASCVRRGSMSAKPTAIPLKKGNGENLEDFMRTVADEFEAREQRMSQCPDVYLNVYDMVGFIVML